MKNFSAFFLLAFLIFSGFSAHAANKYALIIGIDEYQPKQKSEIALNASRGSWTNLDGCVNDAKSIQEIITTRYGFNNKNIATLFNAQASRNEIIKQMEALAAKAQKGDVIFIYYAGHGSQVKNSLSKEEDGKDESMVPADSYLGSLDIRDKELAALYNKILAKGATLTVILDSCHSGSSSRGNITEAPKARFIEAGNYDAKDATIPKKPEDNGALIIAAAQDYEFAMEQRDENDIAHGAFTLALLNALRELPVDVPAKDLFSSVRSIIKFYGKSQEPVMSGSVERQNQNIFGIKAGELSGKILVPVIKVNGGEVTLQGGFVSGLYPGAKLKPATAKAQLEIEIDEVVDANKSLAKVTTGDGAEIKPGDLMEVTEWVYPAHAALKIYIPKDTIPAKELAKYAQAYQKAISEINLKLIQDPTKTQAAQTFMYKSGKWGSLSTGKENAFASLKADVIEIKKQLPDDGSVFINFPPTNALLKNITLTFGKNSNVELVDDANDAQYVLVGRLSTVGNIEYALVKSEVDLSDTNHVMPLRTDFVSAGSDFKDIAKVSSKLTDYARRLAKIRAWLTLENPGGSSHRFPFDLVFEKSNKEQVKNTVKLNDDITMYFKADEEYTDEWDRKKRFVYIFAIDSKGNMQLIFPDANSGSVENKLPVVDADGNAKRTFIADMTIVPPLGTDHYFMLATDEPITNLSAFNQEGVLSRGQYHGQVRGLDNLLEVGASTRGSVKTKTNWYLKKVSLKAVE